MSSPASDQGASGYRIEIVQYDEIQFTKAPSILRGMGAEGLGKTSDALEELSKKGMSPDA